jgi:serine/threonine protein kinase
MDEEAIFLQAVEIGSVAGRTAFLDEACGTSRRLRTAVELLLKHHDLAGEFLEQPPAGLQHTAAAWQGDTLNSARLDPRLALLAPCPQPGCIGQLGPYQIEGVIGQGGMGVVLQARDPKLNRRVAIKLMSACTSASPAGRERFLREARAAAAVKHDNVVTIHAVHDDGPLPFLVMELIEGASLEEKLASHTALPAAEIVQIGTQIAAGLEAAHQRGLVHRDIKPANILLEAGGNRVKITDFGLARATDDGRLTREGELAGTPQYMSPEQARGQPADHRSDLFSLGSLLYLLCTGRPAFAAESTLATLRAICDDHPQPIRAANPEIPGWLEALVLRLLEKAPDDRPRSAGEVEQQLRAGGANLEAPAQQAGSLRDRERLDVATSKADRKKTSLRPTLAAFIPLGTIALAGIVLVLTRNGKSTRVEVPEGATVRIDGGGVVEVDLPGDGAPRATPRAEMPAPLEEVVAELVRLNRGFDGRVEPSVVNREVVELELNIDRVTNIKPLERLSGLRRLALRGSEPGSGQLADLSPLRGMPLEWLICINTNVTDLTPLAGMPLKLLQVQGTKVSSLSPLRGMPLVDLNISFTPVTDLAPLRGMKLVSFYCDGTRIADLSALEGMPLVNLNWRGYEQTDPRHQQLIRSITTLETINNLPAAEFWKSLAAQHNE